MMDSIDNKVLEMKETIIENVRESIRIKSVQCDSQLNAPFGEGVKAALEHALKLSKYMGFKAVNLNDMIGYAEYGDGDEIIAVLGHLDVVPEGEGWTYPPFGAEIHKGKIYGRGTLDDKGPTIGALFALKAIVDLELPISKRVRIIFGTNEENDSKGIKHYVENDEIPAAGFTPDAEYPIINAEKGIITFTLRKRFQDKDSKLILINGGTAPNVVPAEAEARVILNKNEKKLLDELIKINGFKIEVYEDVKPDEFIIKSYGKSAHGSVPHEGKNAISQLIKLLSKLGFQTELKVLLELLEKYFSNDTSGVSLDINMKDDISGKLTVNLGTINGDCNEVKVRVNIRYPVTKDYNEIMAKIQESILDMEANLENIKHKSPLYIPPSSELIQKLQKVYKEKTGEDATLLAIGGGTYAKSMKNIVAFGPIFPNEDCTIHEPDEYISIDSLIKNVQIMASAIYELAK